MQLWQNNDRDFSTKNKKKYTGYVPIDYNIIRKDKSDQGGVTVLTEKQILQQFQTGYDCAQIIWLFYAPALELSESEALEYASASGTGVFRRKDCGALDGAASVLKMFYGYSPFDEYESDPCVDEKLHELKTRFADINGAVTCSALLGMDLTTADDVDFSSPDTILSAHCPGYVASALSLIDDIIGRDF